MKSNLEKAKQALEKETSELTMEVRSLVQAKQDGEHKRKKLEGQVADLQSRFADSEKQKADLGERCSKITVNDPQQSHQASTKNKKNPLKTNFVLIQIELESVTNLLNEAESKNIKLSKDVSSITSQLQDTQVTDRERDGRGCWKPAEQPTTLLDSCLVNLHSMFYNRSCWPRRRARNCSSLQNYGKQKTTKTVCRSSWKKRWRPSAMWRDTCPHSTSRLITTRYVALRFSVAPRCIRDSIKKCKHHFQLSDSKKKLEEMTANAEMLEEGKKRLQRDLEAANTQYEEKAAAYDKLEKTKNRLQQELEDTLMDLDSQRQVVSNLEKKQKKFDQVSCYFKKRKMPSVAVVMDVLVLPSL